MILGSFVKYIAPLKQVITVYLYSKTHFLYSFIIPQIPLIKEEILFLVYFFKSHVYHIPTYLTQTYYP